MDNQVRIEADDSDGRHQIARYMIRAFFSMDKTEYKAEQGVIVYRSKLARYAQAELCPSRP